MPLCAYVVVLRFVSSAFLSGLFGLLLDGFEKNELMHPTEIKSDITIMLYSTLHLKIRHTALFIDVT